MTLIQPSRREGGFTLLELLLVIGVAALLLIGGIATYRLVTEGNRATDATRLLLTLRQEATTMAQQNGGDYTGITYDTAADSAANNVFVASGILRVAQNNPYNGPINIAPNGTNQVDITFDQVTKPGCIKMFSAINNPSEIASISVNGTATAVTAPADVGPLIAAAQCTLDSNLMVWTLK